MLEGDPCDAWPRAHPVPSVPVEQGADVWYRGWECGWHEEAERWTGAGWEAYKGGCDLDAPSVNVATWQELLDMVDEAEDC